MSHTLAQLEAFVSSPAYDAATAGLIALGIPALPRLKGEQIAPGITRIRGNLCNVHGKYGPCDKAKSGKKKPGKGRKPAKPKQTPEQRTAARDAEHQANRGKTLSQQGYSPADQTALEALRSGAQPTAVSPELIDQGVVEQATDGSYRLTSSGRALLNAAGQADAGRARDTVSGARDRLSARRQRQATQAKRQQDAAGKRAASQMSRELSKREREQARAKRQAEAAAKKPAGGGGEKKPEARAIERPRRAAPAKRVRRNSAPSVGGVAGASANKKPPPPKAVQPAKAPAKQIAPALQESVQALSEGKELSEGDTQSLIRNGLAKLNKDGTLILTAAGMRATQKEAPAHTGVMVALYPDVGAAKAIAAQQGVTEPVDELHLTLAFLGDSSETALATNKDKLVTAIKQWATEKGQSLKGTINGLGRFFHAEDDQTNAVFVSPDVPGLPELRQSLCDWIKQSGFDYAQSHGFTPHITVAYVPLKAPTPPIRIETPVAFKQITLAWGDERYDYPLGAVTTKAQTAEDRAMFAKMGGGSGGGGGGGKGKYEGKNTLWPKGSDGKREDPEGLFGRGYTARQTEVQGRARQRDQARAATDAQRESFFAKQTPTSSTPNMARVSAPKQQTPTVTTSHARGTDAPENYRALDQAAGRAKPKGAWSDPSSEKQQGYAASLNARARGSTKEGGDTRALSDEIAKQLPKMNKWEASQLIDAMQRPKPMSTLIASAKEYLRTGSPADAPGRALFALPNFRLRLIDTILAEDASSEGLPF